MTTQAPPKTNRETALAKTAVLAREPFHSFETLRQMMDSVLGTRTFPELTAELEPAINLYEKDGQYTLECAVPGYKKDDIKVEARGDQVVISGSYAQEKAEDKNHYHYREMRKGSFSRAVSLPQEVDPDQVAAKLESGVLTITLHPTKAIRSKTIPVTG